MYADDWSKNPSTYEILEIFFFQQCEKPFLVHYKVTQHMTNKSNSIAIRFFQLQFFAHNTQNRKCKKTQEKTNKKKKPFYLNMSQKMIIN